MRNDQSSFEAGGRDASSESLFVPDAAAGSAIDAPSRREIVRGGVGAVVGGALLSACGGDESASTASSAITVAGVSGGSLGPLMATAVSGEAPILPMTKFDGQDWFVVFMEYDPETAPDAPYFRSVVPLAPRIAPLAATQAHPAMKSRPGAATLSTINRTIQAGIPDQWRKTRHAAMPEGGVQVARRLGTHDIVVAWGGTGLVPNPAMTDVAHRNGALCLGTIFQPERRALDGSLYPLEQVALQYVKMAKYFGYDGYFVNHEGGSSEDAQRVAKFMASMRRAATQLGLVNFHVQYYNGRTDLGSLFAAEDGSTEPAANSIMPDQGWSEYRGPGGCCSGGRVEPKPVSTDGIAEYPSKTVYDIYYGFQLYPGPGYIGVAAPEVIAPNVGRYTFGGLNLYSVDDGFLGIYRARRRNTGAAFLPADIDIPTIERMVYSGKSQNPALDNTPTPAEQSIYDFRIYPGIRYYSEWATTNDDYAKFNPDQGNLPITYGVANFIAERSVIGAMPFVTSFNEGEGKGFFVDGAQVSSTAWFNLGIQDILPTWQWWRAPLAGITDRAREVPGLLDVKFDHDQAYEGGTSLRVTGNLYTAVNTRVHLFKTDILVSGGAARPKIEVVTRSSSADRQRTKIGLIFADGETVWLSIVTGATVTNSASGWVTSAIDLRPYAGRRIASVLLGFVAVGRGMAAVDIRFGRLAITDSAPVAPAAPTGVTLERRVVDTTTGVIGLALRWQGAGRYDVFWKASANGARTWIGRVDGTSFFSPTALPAGTGTVTIEVQSVGTAIRGGSASIQG